MSDKFTTWAEAIDVLLVDDDADYRWLTRDALEQGGHPCRIHEAASAEDALAMLHRSDRRHEWVNPDVIYLDIELPGVDGLALLRILKGEPELRDIPVVIVTGQELTLPQRDELYQRGAALVILKTRDAAEMIRQLQCPLERLFPVGTSRWKTK